MTHILSLLLTFSGAALSDVLLVLWVHYAERNKKLQVFLFAMLQGAAGLCGIGGALTEGWAGIAACVFGYGCGSLLGIWIKGRLG